MYPAAKPLAKRIAQNGIAAAAVDVFARHGLAATRVEDILEASGVARRTFYKYFASKEEVLAAIYEMATTELVKAIRAIDPKGDPLAGTRAGLDFYLDYHVENAPLLKVLTEQAIRSDSPLAGARHRFRAELAELMGRAVHEASGETHDPMLFLALVSALEGLSLDMLAEGPTPAKVARAKRVMHRVLDRVLAPAPVIDPAAQ